MKYEMLLKQKLLIVEDQSKLAEHLLLLLKPYFLKVFHAHDGCEALEISKKLKPDIILSDIEMPCKNGLDFIDEIKKILPHALIFYITAFSHEEYFLKAIDQKVDGYFIKPLNIMTLLEKVVDKLDEKGLQKAQNKHLLLSSQEYSVFLALAKGKKNSQIALEMKISTKTVSTYRSRVLKKLLCNSNAELTAYALQNGLL